MTEKPNPLPKDEIPAGEADCVEIACATDQGMLIPALTMLTSANENCSKKVKVHFLGYDISSAGRASLVSLCQKLGAALTFYELSDEMLAGARQRDKNITLVTLARMYLPQLVPGKVIYIDCDTLILGDLKLAYETPLDGALIGAVRDFFVLHRTAEHGTGDKRLSNHAEVMSGYPITDYFNAGFLVMDCEGIRESEGLPERLLDFEKASQFKLLDQDYLNLIFKGRVRFIGQEWNEIWGKQRLRSKVASKILGDENHANATKLIHYTGPHKPWKPLRLSTSTRGRLPAFLKYRLAERRMRRVLTDRAPGMKRV